MPRHARSLLTLWLSLLVWLGLALSPHTIAHAQEPPLVYENFNTQLTLEDNGRLHVRMVQQIRFDDEFSEAFFAIPKRFTTAIENIRLWEAASAEAAANANTSFLEEIRPDSLDDYGDEIVVNWSYAPTAPGDYRLFVLEYDAVGTVWVYPTLSLLSWQAVNADRSGLTVNHSTVTLTLPPSIPLDQVTLDTNLDGVDVATTDQTITFVAAHPIPDGIPFMVNAYLPPGMGNFGVQDWQRDVDADQLQVLARDFTAHVTVDPSGQLKVHEEVLLDVLVGTLHQGYQQLKLEYVDGIEITGVTVDGTPLLPSPGECQGCYLTSGGWPRGDWVTVDEDTDQLVVNLDRVGTATVDWYAPAPIDAGNSVAVAVDYVATGALRVLPENQFMTWQVVPDWGIPVEKASLILTLPPGVTPDAVTVEGPTEQGAPQIQPDGSLRFDYDGAVVPNAWSIAVTLPAAATAAEKPLWQQQFEDATAAADAAVVARARRAVIERVISILAAVALVLAAIVWWVQKGRKRAREALGGYISEPPSPLSPALVAYLVDRKTSEQGILGAIFFLATLGLVEVDTEGGIKLRRLRKETLEYTTSVEDVTGRTAPISRHLRVLFDKVIVPHVAADGWTSLDDLAGPLRDQLPEIYAALGSDVQTYFIGIPGSRDASIPSIAWFLVYGTLILLLWNGLIPWWLAFVVGFIAISAYVAWTALRETGVTGYSDMGARAADLWRKFKTYLLDIERYGDQGEAQAILDRYFGYVVAFGIAEVVLAKAERMGARVPAWMLRRDVPTDSRTTTTSRRTAERTPPVRWFPRPQPPAPAAEPPAERPTLASMSAALGDSLKRASQSMGQVLATAAGDADAAGRSVVLETQLKRRELTWQPGTSVNTMLDDIMRQSVADAREIQAREVARRQAAAASSSSDSWWSGSSGGGGGSRGSSSSRSSGGFGSSSRSSSSSSSSSSSRSGGGGRSGFR